MNVSKFVSRFSLSLAIGSLCAVGAIAQDSPSMASGTGMNSGSMSSGMSTADKTFVKKAAQGGMAEVELGKLATERASNPDVKQFGQRMVDDHSKANDQLKEVASSQNIMLPQSLDAKDEALKQKLSALSGAAFDRAYMSDMVKDHTQDVAEFQHESSAGQDPAIKNFASQTLPTLQSHLREAKKIAPKVNAAQQ
jgi:putative membrane protein